MVWACSIDLVMSRHLLVLFVLRASRFALDDGQRHGGTNPYLCQMRWGSVPSEPKL